MKISLIFLMAAFVISCGASGDFIPRSKIKSRENSLILSEIENTDIVVSVKDETSYQNAEKLVNSEAFLNSNMKMAVCFRKPDVNSTSASKFIIPKIAQSRVALYCYLAQGIEKMTLRANQ